MFKRIFFSLAILFSFFGISNGQIIISATGVNNNFSVTYPANFSVLPTGLEFTFFANHTITTGGATLNVNGLGAFPIVKNVNQPLAAGEITTNQAVKVVYSTFNNWQMVSAAPSSSQDWTMLGNTPDSTSNYLGTNNLQPLLFFTNGAERMRISRQGRFGFNMNISSGALMNIKSQGTGPVISIFRSSDVNPIIELREAGTGNARIDLYNGSNANTVQIPSGSASTFFAGGGNFGIGTTAPGNNLHVIGGGRFTNLSSAGTSFVQADNLGNLQITTNTGFLGGTGVQNQLAFFSSANTLTSTGNMFYTPASSSLSLGVISLANGFGSFAIGSNVSVSGPRSLGIGNFVTVSNLGNVAFGDWSSSTPTTLTSSADDQFSARFANGYRLYTKSNLSDGVFISGIGQGGIGIGSLSTAHRLNVSATTITGGEGLARFTVPDASSNYLDILNGNPTDATFLPKIQSNTVGLSSGLVLESLQNNDVLSHPSLFIVNGGFTAPTSPFGGRQIFEIQNGTQLRFRVSSDGTTRIASLTSSGNNFVQANSLGDLFISTNTGNAPFWALGGNSVPGVRTIGTSNNFDIPFITNNIERMRINSLGRIGINTSIPGVLLDIKGTTTGTSTAFRILDSNNAASFNVLDNGATGIGASAISGYQLYLNTATADPNFVSLYINNLYSGASNKYGIYNNVSGDGSGSKFCLYNSMVGLLGDNSSIYGIYNNINPLGSGFAYGSYISFAPVGTSPRYGQYVNVTGAANNPSSLYGNYITVSHQSTTAGTATYVLFGNNSSNANGSKYGIYMLGEEQNYFSNRIGVNVVSPAAMLDIRTVAGTTYALKIVDGKQGLGNILVSDASGNATWESLPEVAFSVTATTTQSFPSATNTIINFPGEVYDLGNDFASNTFTVPQNGIYHFDACIRWSNFAVADNYVSIGIYVNGAVTRISSTGSITTNTFSNCISTDLQLTAGNLVTVRAYQSSGGAELTTSNGGANINTFFSGHKVR